MARWLKEYLSKYFCASQITPLTGFESFGLAVQTLDHCVSTINDHCKIYGSTDKPFMRPEQKSTQRHKHLHV